MLKWILSFKKWRLFTKLERAGFSKVNAKRLAEFIVEQSQNAERKVAAFDADGTLWRGDLGETFVQYQIREGLLRTAPKEGAWEKYFQNSIRPETAAEAFGWLAQWNEGYDEHEFQKLCDEFFDREFKSRIFPGTLALIEALRDAGFELWVVSGSIRWIVASGARHFGISAERVRGTSVKVRDGKLTNEIDYTIPYRAGKSTLVAGHIKVSPLFAAGNTFWDKELIMTVRNGLGLAIESEERGEVNYDSEQKLQAVAVEQGWLRQKFSGRD